MTAVSNPSLMSHISIGTNNFERAVKFYDVVLQAVGGKRIADYPEAVAYGREFPEFWVHPPQNGKPAETANGVHFAFLASSIDAVEDFYRTAIEMGAKDEGAPGPREAYGPAYFGCFVRDLDGHKIEAMFWDDSKVT